MTSLLTSVIRINSPALLVSYNLGHGKGRSAPKPLLQEEEAENLFVVTKDENLFIFAQINHLQNDFIMQKTSVHLKIQRIVHSGAPPNLFNYILCLALLRVLLRPPRRALHRQRLGMYTGQFVYYGRCTELSIGNVRACTWASSSTAAAAPRSPLATSHRIAGPSKAPSSAMSSTMPANMVPLRRDV